VYLLINLAFRAFGGISLIVVGILFFFISKDPPVERTKTWKEYFKETFTVESYRENKSLYVLLLFLFINTIGVQLVAPYLFIYVESVLGLGGFDLAIVLGGFALMAIVLTIPIGILLDKVGRKKVMIIITISASITAFLFTFVPANQENTLILALIIGGLIMGFNASIVAAAATWLQDLAPEDRRGSLLAYRIAAMVLPMIPGSLIGGLLADFGPKPAGFIYSPIIFIVSAVVVLFSLPIIKNVEETLKSE